MQLAGDWWKLVNLGGTQEFPVELEGLEGWKIRGGGIN